MAQLEIDSAPGSPRMFSHESRLFNMKHLHYKKFKNTWITLNTSYLGKVKIPFFPGTDDCKMPRGCSGGGGGREWLFKLRID